MTTPPSTAPREWWVPPAPGPTWQHQVRRVSGRARFLAASAAHPALRGGPPIMLGPRSSFVFGAEGTLRRGAGLVLEDGFAGTFFAAAAFGSSVFVGRGAVVAVYGGLTVGDRVRFGERVSVHDEDHATGADGRDGFLVSPIVIGSDVWIGAGAVILRGSVIGEGAVVAAGAVVRGPVAARSVVAGVPARPIGSRPA